jgi:hypothetical protein
MIHGRNRPAMFEGHPKAVGTVLEHTNQWSFVSAARALS